MIGDYCVSSESEKIKKEIANYGPVIVTIPIYRDFLVYSSGLYQVYPKNQRFSAEHAVKIIGWDVIEGQNCWIIENSWGEEWGQNGTAYFIHYLDALLLILKNSMLKDLPLLSHSIMKRLSKSKEKRKSSLMKLLMRKLPLKPKWVFDYEKLYS